MSQKKNSPNRQAKKAYRPSDIDGIKNLISKSTYYKNKRKYILDEIDAIEKSKGSKADDSMYKEAQIYSDMQRDYHSAYMFCYNLLDAYKEDTGLDYDKRAARAEAIEFSKKCLDNGVNITEFPFYEKNNKYYPFDVIAEVIAAAPEKEPAVDEILTQKQANVIDSLKDELRQLNSKYTQLQDINKRLGNKNNVLVAKIEMATETLLED